MLLVARDYLLVAKDYLLLVAKDYLFGPPFLGVSRRSCLGEGQHSALQNKKTKTHTEFTEITDNPKNTTTNHLTQNPHKTQKETPEVILSRAILYPGFS